MLRRNGPVVKSVESVLRLEGSLWGERFVEEVGDRLIHTARPPNDKLHCAFDVCTQGSAQTHGVEANGVSQARWSPLALIGLSQICSVPACPSRGWCWSDFLR